ncbi:MAG: 30S ribosomal protein S2, partial [Bacteroidales bacterium]|nr:30S ribosomal protein S2 [Bacteroidales bacterium]
TCCDPTPIDFVIPANDDGTDSVECVVNILCAAIQEGLDERKLEKDKEAVAEESEEAKPAARKLRSRKGGKPAEQKAE